MLRTLLSVHTLQLIIKFKKGAVKKESHSFRITDVSAVSLLESRGQLYAKAINDNWTVGKCSRYIKMRCNSSGGRWRFLKIMDDCFAWQVINCAFHQGKCTLAFHNYKFYVGFFFNKNYNVSTLEKKREKQQQRYAILHQTQCFYSLKLHPQ